MMNIFYVDADPIIAAQSLCDKHVVKMCLETAQILCTVAHRYGIEAPYAPTHEKHPCVLWAGDDAHHLYWLAQHAIALWQEYNFRYQKIHASKIKTIHIISHLMFWEEQPDKEFTEPPQCMPEQYKVLGDAVAAYRAYYIGEKSRFAQWNKGRLAPKWYTDAFSC